MTIGLAVSFLITSWAIAALIRIRTVDAYLSRLINDYGDAQQQEIRELGLSRKPGEGIDWSGYDTFHKLSGKAVDREIKRAWSYAWCLWRTQKQLCAPGAEIVRQAQERLTL